MGKKVSDVKKGAITQEDIDSFLKTESDFSFEMQVTNLFYKICDEVFHGGTYDDPVTQKHRQFDIRARITKEWCHLRIAAECKNLKNSFPLVVSRIPRKKSESYHEILCYSKKVSSKYLVFGANIDTLIESANTPLRTKTVRIAAKNTFYEKDAFVGKSTTQIGKSGVDSFVSNDSAVFEKWAQAVSSSYGLLGLAGDDHKLTGEGISSTVIIPALIVPDSTLWIVDYDLTGAVVKSPCKVDHCSIYIGKDISGNGRKPNYAVSHLEVFTFSGLEGFLNSFKTGESLESWFPFDQLEEEIAFL